MLLLPWEKHARLRAIKVQTSLSKVCAAAQLRGNLFLFVTVAEHSLSFGLSNEKQEHAVVGLISLQRIRK